MKRLSAWFVLIAAGLAAGWGCTPPKPPKELVDARAHYEEADEGLAPKLAPAALDDAKQALDRAEASFADEPEEPATVHLAYIADRKALLAAVNAEIERAERKKKGAESAYKETTEQELERARRELASGKQALAAEKKARLAAERRAQAAIASLKEVATVKAEKRGVVITLSGAVLFASGKSNLLPIAKEKLKQVADMLKEQGYPTIVVEGHTDSVGPKSVNMTLSQKRADAVAEYLASQGVPATKITALGLGPDRPVAENTTAEGRANNRRVEIVMKN